MVKDKHKIEVDIKTKEEINRLEESIGLNTNDLIYNLIQEYDTYEMKLKTIKKELEIYKERELEAFAIGDAISDGIYIIDRKGTVIAVNKIYTTITGYNEDEVIGKNVEVLMKNKFSTKAVSLMVLDQKKKVSGMSTMMRTNKKVLVTGNPIFNNQGEITQVLTVMRDITQLIELKERLENSEKASKRYRDELEYFRKQQLQKSGLIGESLNMKQIKELIFQIAQVDTTVLITGETGVGKEVIAREIYKTSLRKNGPYIKVNCAAIPENLLESELFGYEKGAFTGAQNKDKLGLFEMANSGTILLDEIGEMPMNLQPKILRVLQEKELTRIGGTKPKKLDVRVIAATNRKLEQQVNDGLFREDLYYRLNVIPIQIPPLRSRREDITLLANFFLQKYNKKYSRDKSIDISALEVLEQYEWPGNVRELENLIERLVVIVNEDIITRCHILKMLDNRKISSIFLKGNDLSLKEAVSLVEKRMIGEALKKHGSTYKAARVLGVSQPTILRKAKALGITNW